MFFLMRIPTRENMEMTFKPFTPFTEASDFRPPESGKRVARKSCWNTHFSAGNRTPRGRQAW